MFNEFPAGLRETDHELRKRLIYVAGRSQLLEFAEGTQLDEIAEQYNLRRRIGGR